MRLLFLVNLVFVFLACSDKTKSKAGSKKPDALVINMDTTVSPAQDFFQYANGGWIKNNPIPAEQSSWGIGNLVVEENLKRLRTIAEDAAKKNPAKGSAEQKIGDFWTMAMDSAKIEERVGHYLDLVGLSGFESKKPWPLSTRCCRR